MAKMRIQTAREAVLSYLKKNKGVEVRQTELYSHARTQGFPNQNTIRGRLSELFTDGVIERRKGISTGTVWYRYPVAAPAHHEEFGGESGVSL